MRINGANNSSIVQRLYGRATVLVAGNATLFLWKATLQQVQTAPLQLLAMLKLIFLIILQQ
jgi:hypothetical protein